MTSMATTRGIESSNIVEGSRKRQRGQNDVAEEANASPARMGTIERRIASLSVQQVNEYGTQLLNTLLQATDPTDGSPLHENFLELPDAQEYPDYYEIIKRPMAFDEIQGKLEERSYTSLPDVKHDCETICNNAKRYNVRDSLIWVQAKELHSLIKITYVQIIESLPEPGSAPIAAPEQPVSAEGAAPSSQPRKRILLKTSKSQPKLEDTPADPPQQQQAAVPTPERTALRAFPLAPEQHTLSPSTPVRLPAQPAYPSSAAASSHYDTPGADDDDQDLDGDGDDDDDGPRTKLTKGGLLDGRKRPGKRGKRLKATLRQLFHNLRRMVGSRGYPLGQHFDVLPSRRDQPDYYQIIQKPISLRDIERRVYDKSYINAYALFMDLEQMLNNAQTYYDPHTEIWRDAQEIHGYFEREAIPALIQDGFTLEKDDVRQSALPLHLAANSTIEAHKIAFKMIVAKTGGVEGDSSLGSASPEPSAKLRYGSAGLPVSPSVPAVDGMPMSSLPMPSPSHPGMGLPPHSMSPMPYMSAASPPHGMPPAPASFNDRTPRHVPVQHTPQFVAPIIPPLPERRAGPGRPRKAEVAARQAHYAAQAAAQAAAAAAAQQHNQHDPYGTMMQSPMQHGAPAQWQHAQYLQQQQQQRQLQQQQQHYHQPQTHLAQPPAHHIGSSPVVAPPADVTAPLPTKKKDYLLPAEPPAPLPFEEMEERLPLISHFSIDVQLEAANGHSPPSVPVVIKNSTAKHHSLQVPATATAVVVEFPLRILRQSTPTESGAAGNGDADPATAPAEEAKTEETRPSKRRPQVHPWWPHLLFNGKQVSGSWTSSDDAEIDPDLLDETSNVGVSHCRVRLHPRRGPNVFDITIKPDANCGPPLDQLPPERYSLFLS